MNKINLQNANGKDGWYIYYPLRFTVLLSKPGNVRMFHMSVNVL